jgi:hypothetical protein
MAKRIAIVALARSKKVLVGSFGIRQKTRPLLCRPCGYFDSLNHECMRGHAMVLRNCRCPLLERIMEL